MNAEHQVFSLTHLCGLSERDEKRSLVEEDGDDDDNVRGVED